MAASGSSYASWSRDELIQRVQVLEETINDSKNTSNDDAKHLQVAEENPPTPLKKPKIFDWSKHNTRFIALKFAYLGKRYNGFEHHANNPTPLPTIEETLWHALMKAKLINPTGNLSGKKDAVTWEGCEYSKCGRTDKGVSAFGQVIGLRVRSNRPVTLVHDAIENGANHPLSATPEGAPKFDDLNDEMPYIHILNSLLPPDIRVLAWCPSPPEGFNARFSCRARHYKYFFTQPAYMPTPGPTGLRNGSFGTSVTEASVREGWLDIARMQDAAKRFEGLHDFRHFCKVDASKQISDHRRRIFRSQIQPLKPQEQPAAYVSSPLFVERANSRSDEEVASDQGILAPQIYVFDLQGSAFLWHQVRHMVGVLFLIGQGLEKPDLIDRMLDSSQNPEKPVYEMADEAPLVLWNCIFPAAEDSSDNVDSFNESLQWIYAGEVTTSTSRNDKVAATLYSTKYGIGGAVDTTWGLWREAKMDEILRGSLLNLIAHQPDALVADPHFDISAVNHKPFNQKTFIGAEAPAHRGKYIPMLMRERMKSVEVQNREYAEKRGITPKTTSAEPPETRPNHKSLE